MISFGFFKPAVEFAPDRIVITRRATLSYVLLAMMGVGIGLIALALKRHHPVAGAMAPGVVLTIPGIFAVFSTPWFTPARIELSRDGLAWGRAHYAPSQIVLIRADAVEHRSGPHKKYSQWALLLVVRPQRGLRLDCGQHATWTAQAPLFEVARMMNSMLEWSRRPAA